MADAWIPAVTLGGVSLVALTAFIVSRREHSRDAGLRHRPLTRVTATSLSLTIAGLFVFATTGSLVSALVAAVFGAMSIVAYIRYRLGSRRSALHGGPDPSAQP